LDSPNKSEETQYYSFLNEAQTVEKSQNSQEKKIETVEKPSL